VVGVAQGFDSASSARRPAIGRDEASHALHETPRGVDCGARVLGRDVRTGAGLVIGNRFEIVGAAKECPQLMVNTRVASGCNMILTILMIVKPLGFDV
jgi:hypothetical protein